MLMPIPRRSLRLNALRRGMADTALPPGYCPLLL